MTTVPIRLHFEDCGEWYSLPDWAEYFISVGKFLASAPNSETRIVTAIVVPTRAFAAAFVSLGMVIADAASRNQTTKAAHFEKLFDLPPGSPVIYLRKPGETYRGIVREPMEREGELLVRIQVDHRASGGRTFAIDESLALRVHPANHTGKLPKKQRGDNVKFANQFVDSLLGESDPVHLGLHSKLVCTLVGKKNTLEHEIRKTPLAVYVNGHFHAKGHLQDILRINRFVTEQQSHRSALVPSSSEPPASETVNSTKMGVIFDGALGFLKWGEMWYGCHQVVILDRTESYFDDAISAINNRFSQNRVEGETFLPKCDAPPGGEVLTFLEAIK